MRTRVLSWVLGVFAFSCQSDFPFSNPEPAQTSSLASPRISIGNPHARVFMFVVDDADTPDAAAVRARLPQSLRERLLHDVHEHWNTGENADPARWHPGDARVLLVRPSASDTEALLTWVDVPDLAWITTTSKEEEIEPITLATTQALENRLAKPDDVYRPLRATASTLDLISRQREPANASEMQFMATLPGYFSLDVVIASTRTDTDPIPTTSTMTAWDQNEQFYISDITVIGPFPGGNVACEVYAHGDTPLEQWADGVFARFVAWPCLNEDTWRTLLGGWFFDGSGQCYSHPISIAADGSANCKVFLDQPNLSHCDPARGWRDIDGANQFGTYWGKMYRRCEIEQFAGAKLETCRHSLQCPDCGSGFCVTEVPELVPPQEVCPGTEVPWPLRFTGGSIAVSEGFLQIYCETQMP